ncbi:pyridoxal phosphate-dependent transferase [Vararia minispora EC-137]|uniref:Pyridoxal phosphate-dependent transferase n=1 Tax=Vararia minispora EC-137 TaxID=1314806 RepID=A0ACB8QSP9_9AGAM|nr:pyridoxal phosphate-dependent transferase [Vararia minispora EC-137]
MSSSIEEKRAQIASLVKFDILTESQTADNERSIRDVSRTFISDTITVPTREMYEYAVQASIGDAVYHEPSTIALEAHMAKLTGKEAALFMPSGTMSNQIALRSHLTQPPYSVLCDYRAHINKYEAGGTAFHSGAHTVPIIPSNGHHLTLKDVKEFVVIGDDVHLAPTRVIELENTLNGSIFPQDEIIRISEFAHGKEINMHLDGARIWHVAAETGTSLEELCEPFDSVSLCFSKGLGAPIGSCLVGSHEFIKRAKWFRKLFGGGMRQTGAIAACAAYALTHNFSKLPAVHALAGKLEKGMREIGVDILGPAETCMVFYDPTPIGVDYNEIAQRAEQLPEPLKLGGSRLVVHIQTTELAIDDFLRVLRDLAKEKRAAGFIYHEPNGVVNGSGHYKDIYIRRK